MSARAWTPASISRPHRAVVLKIVFMGFLSGVLLMSGRAVPGAAVSGPVLGRCNAMRWAMRGGKRRKGVQRGGCARQRLRPRRVGRVMDRNGLVGGRGRRACLDKQVYIQMCSVDAAL